MRITVFAGLLAAGLCGCAEAPVVTAVKTGNLQGVQSAFAQGLVKQKALQQAMCPAAASGRNDILKVLIAKGGLVNDDLAYPTHETMSNVHQGLCRCADAESKKVAYYQTPLICAAKFDRPETVEFLLAASADINARNGFYRIGMLNMYGGSTALIFAAAQGHEDVVKILLAHGADTTYASVVSGGEPYLQLSGTAAEMARKNGHEHIALLIEGKAPSEPVRLVKRGGKSGREGVVGEGDGGENPSGALHLFNMVAGFVPGLSAVTSVTSRLERGANVVQTGQSVYQVAHPAPVPGAAAEAAAPVAARAPGLSALAERHEPQLHTVAEKGDARTLQFMLDKGADVREKCEGGETALHHAALMGRDEAVKILLAAGADADAQDDDHVTPLIAASLMGHRGTVQILLGAHAAPNTQDKLGHTALMKTCFPPVNTARSDVMVVIAADLIAAKADPNIADNDGWTPLMAASMYGNATLVKELIAAKADPNAKTQNADTALSLARKKHADGVTAILVQAGAKD